MQRERVKKLVLTNFSKKELNEYQKNHAPELQKKHTSKFDGKFVAFRTLLEEV